jgi:hypothetical protein
LGQFAKLRNLPKWARIMRDPMRVDFLDLLGLRKTRLPFSRQFVGGKTEVAQKRKKAPATSSKVAGAFIW